MSGYKVLNSRIIVSQCSDFQGWSPGLTHNTVQFVSTRENIRAFILVPWPALRVWESHLDGVVLL